MTCIIGLVENGHVYIGGDSAGSKGDLISNRKDEKVFIVKKFIIGYSGSYRLGQILKFYLKPPKMENMDLYKYMCTRFITHISKILSDNAHATIENNEIGIGGNFLVGIKGRLFYIDKDLQVGEYFDGFYAIGSGEHAALGAIHALKSIQNEPYSMFLEPEEMIELALEAAENHTATVRGPFFIKSI